MFTVEYTVITEDVNVKTRAYSGVHSRHRGRPLCHVKLVFTVDRVHIRHRGR
jgi:hypothetical protein